MGIVGTIAEHEAAKVAGVALGGATGGPLGAVVGFLKAYWKPILLGIAALVIVITVASHFANDRHVRKERDGLRAWQNAIIAVTDTELPALKNGKQPALKPDEVASNIHWLGQERRTLATTLDDQSAKLRIAQQKAVVADNGVKEALGAASQRDKGRAATRAALTDPKRSTGLSSDEWGKL